MEEYEGESWTMALNQTWAFHHTSVVCRLAYHVDAPEET